MGRWQAERGGPGEKSKEAGVGEGREGSQGQEVRSKETLGGKRGG